MGDAPLHIAHVTATFPPYYAGTGNVVFHQAGALAARGHEVEVFSATYPGEPVDPPGVRVHRMRPVLRLGNAPLLPGLLRMPLPGVLHLHEPFIFGAELAVARARRAGVPVVASFHNDLQGEGVKGALFRAYNASAVPVTLARAARIAVLSLDHARAVPVLARELERRPQAFVEVPNGVDASTFTPTAAPHGNGRPRAVFAAALDGAHRFKRLDLLLRALAAVPELDLTVAGGGELEPEFRRLAHALGVGGRVAFAGAMPQPELAARLREGDFLVLCSDSVESFGLVQVEALASGIPAVVSDLPGVRTVVEPGVDGLHVTPGDLGSLVGALREMAGMPPGQRRAMGERGREKVLARYTWERSAERLEAVYRELV
jgi:glycosyltransferase involved in cell wall biosynthesis